MTPRPATGSTLPIIVIAGLLVVTASCGPSRPPRVPAPPVDPESMARAVLQLIDTDGDGQLTTAELARVPGLVSALATLDTDGDKRLSAADITTWLTGVRDSKVAVTPVPLKVMHKGKPVAGATLKLVPEPFMGSNVKAAEATTDTSGAVLPTIPGSPYPGVNSGVYRVEITGTLPGGKPIPAKYNTSTTLGLAVGNGLPAETPVTFAID
jgi:hypothetical protein